VGLNSNVELVPYGTLLRLDQENQTGGIEFGPSSQIPSADTRNREHLSKRKTSGHAYADQSVILESALPSIHLFLLRGRIRR
jgi:hypothetical protein